MKSSDVEKSRNLGDKICLSPDESPGIDQDSVLDSKCRKNADLSESRKQIGVSRSGRARVFILKHTISETILNHMITLKQMANLTLSFT